ncbi:DNA repair exonuclease [Sedimentibacter sp. zth1]|uniref:metallophosphoesterase family protein n=1 Tax=Sedimentibacter sp. zth1 TaxID=2816908 RepID=UPI001A9286B3|nr:DNA repair exonuclease [Sedimentibacter sp. zth1]QSX04897.1 DNA repair exonuclease [Sedimentibacter sp. zth1]
MIATFLHTADIHLGVKLKNRGFSLSECEKRRLDIWDTFENIIKIANEENIKYLLIAGDLIDQQYCNFKDMKKISLLFKKINNTKVIITCGNKDPYSITCLYDYIKWPENVFIFKNTEDISKFEFEEDNICIYSLCWGEDNAADMEDEIYNLKVDSDKINILLEHCSIDTEDNCPLTLDESIIKHKFDYCALGHIHKYTVIERNVIFPGTPEPFDYDYVNYEHGIIKGWISKEDLKTEFVPICNRRLISKKIVIKNDYDYNKILDSIRQVGENINIMKDYVKIELAGTISNDISINEIKDAAKQFFYYIDFEDNYTYEKSVTESIGKLRGNIIENYITQFEKEDNQDKLYEKAFELGLQLLKNEGGVK